MLHSLAWTLQLLALVVVGAALVVGLALGAVRLELAMMAGGAALFVVGRWLQGRAD